MVTESTELTDAIKEAITKDPRPASKISRMADVPEASLCRFRNNRSGLRLAAADRLCNVLGLRLVRAEN